MHWLPVWVVAIATILVIIFMWICQWLASIKTAQWLTSALKVDQWHTSSVMQAVLQVGITAVTTVFVGTLSRNNSKEQAKAAAKLSNEQELRARSSNLMAHQAAAINHLDSVNDAIRAAGITEIVWLICGWYTLTYDSINAGHPDAVVRWKDHAQELVDLAYKVVSDDGMPSPVIVKARANGLAALQKRLTDRSIPILKNAFQELSFAGTSLLNADMSGANLGGANMSGANLSYMNLKNANLVNAELVNAELMYAYLKGANLVNANLHGANLMATNLEDANLVNANMENSQLECAHLMHVHLESSNLTNAELQGADLREVDSLSMAVLTGAEYNKATQFPDGFAPDAAGMINKSPDD